MIIVWVYVISIHNFYDNCLGVCNYFPQFLNDKLIGVLFWIFFKKTRFSLIDICVAALKSP